MWLHPVLPPDNRRGMSIAVSIVIPAYVGTAAQAALLDETLRTVAAQTRRDYEVIVVDDGSPLDVADIVAAHAQATCVRQANAGVAVARNTGIARSGGEYFVFLDADDHLLAEALETGIAQLTAHPDAGFAVGPREEMTFEGEPVPWAVGVPPPQTHIYAPLLAFEWYIIPPSSAMFRRRVVEAVGGFRDPWGADDLDFYLRAARRFPARCYDAPAVTRYRRYSASSSRDGERMLHSMRRVYERQWPLVAGDGELERAFHAGLSRLTEIFLDCLVENVGDRLRAGEHDRALRSARLLSRESPDRWEALVAAGDPDVRGLASAVTAGGRERAAPTTDEA